MTKNEDFGVKIDVRDLKMSDGSSFLSYLNCSPIDDCEEIKDGWTSGYFTCISRLRQIIFAQVFPETVYYYFSTQKKPVIDEFALNSAGWEFIKKWPDYTDQEMSGNTFNNLKPILRSAIEKYLNEAKYFEN